MDTTRLANEEGFLTTEMFIRRMLKFKQPAGDYFCMTQIKGSAFSQIGVMAYDKEVYPLFKVYTGNKELYEIAQQMFKKAAAALGYGSRTYIWKDEQ